MIAIVFEVLVICVALATCFLVIAVVGTAAGWWDWLGLIGGDDDDE